MGNTAITPRRGRPRRAAARALAMGVAMLVAAVAAAVAESTPDPADASLTGAERVAALIDRIKSQQAQMQSLAAHFVQTKHSLLLLEPEEARGTFSYQAPDRARWEFSHPSQTVMVIRGEEMLTWYRDLGTAERISVGRQTALIEQYLSATNAIDRLQRYFSLSTAFPEDGRPYRIELTPRYRRIAKRLTGMTIWFDRERYVPVRLSYVEPDGDTTELVFDHIEINPKLAPDHFDFTLPAGVEVETLELGP